jgi:hypothetical protein
MKIRLLVSAVDLQEQHGRVSNAALTIFGSPGIRYSRQHDVPYFAEAVSLDCQRLRRQILHERIWRGQQSQFLGISRVSRQRQRTEDPWGDV